MRWDKDRLGGLTENLAFTLNESIYRNALPISIDRVDIASSSIGNGFPTLFVKQLLGDRKIDIEIQVNEDAAHKFHHLFLECNNHKADKGNHTLAFGYPLFIHKENTSSLFPVAAPMFIWEINLSPSANRPDTWTLTKNDNVIPKPNRFLINYLKQAFDLDLENEFKELAYQNQFTGENLSAFCNKISLQLDIAGNTSGFGIVPSPTADEMMEILDAPSIHFSGILGKFGKDHLALSYFLEKKLEVLDSQPMFTEEPENNIIKHPFSLIAPDPCQKHIASASSKNYLTTAEGGTGTGKTTTAFHTATNLLVNGGACLIVSSNVNGLERIQKRLIDNKVDRFSILVKDTDDDLQTLFNQIKNIPSQLKNTNKESDLGLKILLERCLGKHSKLESHHELMNRKAFGNLDFTDTVGHYIDSSRYAGKDVLSGRLDPHEYQFTFREYDILKTDIAKANKLYANIRKINHPLDILNEEIFLEKDMESAKEFASRQISTFNKRVDELLGRFTTSLESYRDNLREHYEEHARELNYKVQKTKDKISEYAQVFGEDFKKSSSVKVKMYGVFSDNYYNIKEARNEIISKFGDIEDYFNEKRYFNYKFPKKKDADKIGSIQKYLLDFEEEMNKWTNNIQFNIRQETESLNSKSVQTHLDYDSRIGELEYTHDLLLEEINQAKLFKQWFSYDGMTLSKRLLSLEELSDMLEKADNNLPQFEEYHPWQKHWLEILPISKSTITALIKSRTKEWLPSFNSWYFYNCLADRTFMTSNRNDLLKEEYIQELSILREKLIPRIHTDVSKKQEAAIIEVRKKNKKLYQLLFGKKNTLPKDVRMKDIFMTFSNEITKWFPIQMMTTDSAEELLISSKAKYDLIIFDDAHNIATIQAVPLADRADRILVLGDRSQSLFRKTHTSLLDSVVEHGSEIIPLYYNHIENERACLEFINYTSYQKGIKTINYFQKPYQKKGISFIKSEGRYNEEEYKNNLEAEDIVRILSEIPLNNKGAMPHTAIVTSTIPQRDHINSYLLYIKQKRNPYSDRISQLEESGLRVLHVSELTENYETIVWSLTYGTTNLRGHISKHFDEMESNTGQTILNIILGHVKHNLIVCSSIPQSYINEKTSGNIKNVGPVMQFLKYALITDAENEEERKEFLESVEWLGIKKNDRESYKFMMQVKKELDPYFEADRIKVLSPLSEIGTAALTIIPYDYKQPIPLIIGDGLDRNNPTVAYEFEDQISKKLKTAGYLIFKTNSIDWWKNPKREARILAAKLIKADNTPPEVKQLNSVK